MILYNIITLFISSWYLGLCIAEIKTSMQFNRDFLTNYYSIKPEYNIIIWIIKFYNKLIK